MCVCLCGRAHGRARKWGRGLNSRPAGPAHRSRGPGGGRSGWSAGRGRVVRRSRPKPARARPAPPSPPPSSAPARRRRFLSPPPALAPGDPAMPVRTECPPPAGASVASAASLIPPPPINTQQPGVATSLLYSGSKFRGHQKSKGNSYDVEVVLQVSAGRRAGPRASSRRSQAEPARLLASSPPPGPGPRRRASCSGASPGRAQPAPRTVPARPAPHRSLREPLPAAPTLPAGSPWPALRDPEAPAPGSLTRGPSAPGPVAAISPPGRACAGLPSPAPPPRAPMPGRSAPR